MCVLGSYCENVVLPFVCNCK